MYQIDFLVSNFKQHFKMKCIVDPIPNLTYFVVDILNMVHKMSKK
jgi:hypothetical protein